MYIKKLNKTFKKKKVFKIIVFELVAVNYSYYDENTCSP